MNKHKIIHKDYSHRKDKHAQLDKNSDDSSGQEFEDLQPINYNSFFHDEHYSIHDMVDNLTPEMNSPPEESEEQPVCEGTLQNWGDVIGCDIGTINALYLRFMSEGQPVKAKTPARAIRFDSRVRVKFFDNEGAVAQVGDAEQYTSNIEQYECEENC